MGNSDEARTLPVFVSVTACFMPLCPTVLAANFTGSQMPAIKMKIMRETMYDDTVGKEGWRKVKEVMMKTFYDLFATIKIL
jgi:hypothetical protein